MVEAGYTAEIAGQETYVAVGYSQSYDLNFSAGKIPEYRILATVGRWIWEGVRLAAEYAYNKDYSVSDGGTGESGHAVTVKLTYEW
jgi:hypothetical protein